MKNEKRGGSTDRPKKGLGRALFFKDLKELEFRTFSIQHTAHRTWRSLLSRLEGALGVRSSERVHFLLMVPDIEYLTWLYRGAFADS